MFKATSGWNYVGKAEDNGPSNRKSCALYSKSLELWSALYMKPLELLCLLCQVTGVIVCLVHEVLGDIM
jgi:hypothetical protein